MTCTATTFTLAACGSRIRIGRTLLLLSTFLLALTEQLLLAQTISPEAIEHWNSARQAESQKNFDTAVAEYKKVTELEPSFATGFVSLGQTFMEQHNFAAAVVPLKHALELDSDLVPAHQLLGYALLAQGYAADAIPHRARARTGSARHRAG